MIQYIYVPGTNSLKSILHQVGVAEPLLVEEAKSIVVLTEETKSIGSFSEWSTEQYPIAAKIK